MSTELESRESPETLAPQRRGGRDNIVIERAERAHDQCQKPIGEGRVTGQNRPVGVGRDDPRLHPDFAGTKVTGRGVEALQKALPTAKINR